MADFILKFSPLSPLLRPVVKGAGVPPLTWGSVSVPWELLWAVVGAVVFRVWLHRQEKNREVGKFWADRVSWSVLIGLLVWKLTPVFTRWDQVWDNPLLLLYASGGLAGLFGGVATAVGILAMSLLQIRKEKGVSVLPETLSLSAGLLVFLILKLGVPVFVPTQATALSPPQKQVFSLLLPGFEGKATALADERGKVLIVNFWASWCPPCRAEFPDFQAAQTYFSAHHLPVILVGLDQVETESGGLAAAKAFASSQHAQWTLLADTAGVGTAFGVQALPTTLVFDRQGQLVARHVGATDRDWLIAQAQKYAP